MISKKVSAMEKFYEGEYIDGIYTKSIYIKNYSTHFQKARFFRRTSDNKEAYCIEPFAFFDQNESYESSVNPSNISPEMWKRMSLIAYYGYGYKNHTDSKWYAITQLLIWKTSNINGEFFFTDTLNGNRVELFQDEINEINNLVENHLKMPSVAGKTYNIKKGTNYIYDDNNVISNFVNTDNLLSIEDNKIDTSNLSEGSYTFSFKRSNNNSNDPVLFYYSPNSQNIMTSGHIDDDSFYVNINVYDTEININKIDKDTGSNVSSGTAKLCDAKFNLYDENSNLIQEVSLDENCSAKIKGLDLGKYYIKESKPGEGYEIDNTVYDVIIDLDNTKINLQISNKVISKEIIIHKEYGTDDNSNPEKDAIFDIYSKDNKYIDTIVTNDKGIARITLPYGEYEFRQVTTKDGYMPVDNFSIKVDNTNTDEIDKMDYIIKVPNTRSDKKSSVIPIILLLIGLTIYVKKRVIN
jgi:hypothetical protein